DAEVPERLDSRAEGRLPRRVALQIDAADFSGAVVDVEVDIERLPLRLSFNGARGLEDELRELDRFRVGGERVGAEVVPHVALRTKKALLFAAPQRDADGAAWMDVERFEDADGFHRDDRARAIVRGASCG